MLSTLGVMFTPRDDYGPINEAWSVLDDAGRASLERQLVTLAERANRDVHGSLAVDSAYLEVIATTIA